MLLWLVYPKKGNEEEEEEEEVEAKGKGDKVGTLVTEKAKLLLLLPVIVGDNVVVVVKGKNEDSGDDEVDVNGKGERVGSNKELPGTRVLWLLLWLLLNGTGARLGADRGCGNARLRRVGSVVTYEEDEAEADTTIIIIIILGIGIGIGILRSTFISEDFECWYEPKSEDDRVNGRSSHTSSCVPLSRFIWWWLWMACCCCL